MLLRTSPQKVLFRGTWSRPEDQGDRRAAWGSGALVEYCKLMDVETGEIRDWTLAESINGECQVDGVYQLLVRQDVEQVASGRGRGTFAKFKHRIIGLEPVEAAKR